MYFSPLKIQFNYIFNFSNIQISEIIQGKVDLKSLNLTAEEKAKYNIEENDSDAEAGIPNFWMTAIKNSKYFPVNEKDDKILTHLRDIKLVLSENKLDYSLEFIFNKNEYFEHEILTLQFDYDEKKFEPTKRIGTNIKWSNADKNPTLKPKSKKLYIVFFYLFISL